MGKDNFRKNLRYLCGFYKSIAEVCRRIDINRQQFNKYLGGQTEPSSYNLRKICNFFRVDEDQLFAPHVDFIRLIGSKSLRTTRNDTGPLPASEFFPQATDSMKKYVGYYFAYVVSPSVPGHYIKSITGLRLNEGVMISKTYEKITFSDPDSVYSSVNKYRGFCFESASLLYLIEHEYLHDRGYIYTALYPSYRDPIQILNGLVLGVSGGNFRRPYSSQIVFEYIGKTTDLRAAIRACGCFPLGGGKISDNVRSRLLVPVSADAFNITSPIL